jgi:hypothetical protein
MTPLPRLKLRGTNSSQKQLQWRLRGKPGLLSGTYFDHSSRLSTGTGVTCNKTCTARCGLRGCNGLWHQGVLRSTCSRYSDWLRAGQPRSRSSSPCRGKNFLFSTSFRPALGCTQPPIQWVPGALSPVVKREADHSQLVPRSTIRESIHRLPHTPSWHSV